MSGDKYSLYDVGTIAPSPSISKPPSAASSQSDEHNIYEFITTNYPNILQDINNYLLLNNKEHIEVITYLMNSLMNDKYFSNLTGSELEELKGMIGVDDINKLIDIAILSYNQSNNKITMNKYITLLESAKIGLANLKFTYYYDQTIISNLDIIIEKIDMFKINVINRN